MCVYICVCFFYLAYSPVLITLNARICRFCLKFEQNMIQDQKASVFIFPYFYCWYTRRIPNMKPFKSSFSNINIKCRKKNKHEIL